MTPQEAANILVYAPRRDSLLTAVQKSALRLLLTVVNEELTSEQLDTTYWFRAERLRWEKK